MSARALWVALSLCSIAPAQRLTAPAEVRFGEPFEALFEAEGAFDPAALQPLEVEVLERLPSAAGERVRLRARCFELGEVTLATAPPFTLDVTSALPTPPGELEWPANGYEAAAAPPPRWVVAGLTALLIVAVYGSWRRLRALRAARGAGASEEAAPAWSAAAALRALEVGAADPEAVLLQVKAILRRFLAQRFELAAEVRTSEELLAALPAADSALRPCLRVIDLGLFSALPANEEDPARTRALALTFVESLEVRA